MNYKNFISIEDSYINNDGIRIDYWFKGESRSILAVPAEVAAELLKKNDLIEDYSGTGNDIEVTWKHSFSRIDYNNELIEEEMKVEASWETFIKEFNFSPEDALSIAAMEEAERAANKEAGVFDKIISGIAKCFI